MKSFILIIFLFLGIQRSFANQCSLSDEERQYRLAKVKEKIALEEVSLKYDHKNLKQKYEDLQFSEKQIKFANELMTISMAALIAISTGQVAGAGSNYVVNTTTTLAYRSGLVGLGLAILGYREEPKDGAFTNEINPTTFLGRFTKENENYLTKNDCSQTGQCEMLQPNLEKLRIQMRDKYISQVSTHRENAIYWLEYFTEDDLQEVRDFDIPYLIFRGNLRSKQIIHLKNMAQRLEEDATNCQSSPNLQVAGHQREESSQVIISGVYGGANGVAQ